MKGIQLHRGFLLWAIAAVCIASAATYSAPAGKRYAVRRPGAASILPGGRVLVPTGIQQITGPGASGLAISPNGRFVVTANGGPNLSWLSIIRRNDNRWLTKHVIAPDKQRKEKPGDDADWRSVFKGLAFDGNGTLYESEGESGGVRKVGIPDGEGKTLIDLDQGGFEGSYTGDLAIDAERNLLYVLDQANFRLVVVNFKEKEVVASLRLGSVPFAIALSPDRRRAYVSSVGIPANRLPDAERTGEGEIPEAVSQLASPPSAGAEREEAQGPADAHGRESNLLSVVDISDPAKPRVEAMIPTGGPVGETEGGSSPPGVLATADRVFVSNPHQDSITVIDARTNTVTSQILLRIPRLENLRGILPIGMAYHEASGWLLVAEAGINAIGVIDVNKQQVIAHIPVGWFPTRVAIHEDNVYVANARGNGVGPTAARDASSAAVGTRRRGSLSVFPLPGPDELPKHSAVALQANGFLPSQEPAAPLPEALKYVVLIVKENRSFDEVFGDISKASNGVVNGVPALARFGSRGYVDGKLERLSLQDVNVTPNHHELASRYAFNDNFYAGSDLRLDGQHWLLGGYPNAWTESARMAARGGQPDAQSDSSGASSEGAAGGRSLWDHLGRHGVPFRNMSPSYPEFRMDIPDQQRASQFIAEVKKRYIDGKEPFPRFLFVHLPNDHMAAARPEDGYPYSESFVADNDYALGRILEFLSGTPWWREMAVFITEDDAQGGRDHVDAHRTILLAAGPYARRDYVSHTNTGFPGLLKTIFRILGVPPLNLLDATASDLADSFTTEPDFTPYQVLPEDQRLFKPEKVRGSPASQPGSTASDFRQRPEQHRQ